MLASQRHKQIIELVNSRNSIKVKELSSICNVSTETIRQDLKKLENEKKIYRVHGGACSLNDGQKEVPYYEREIFNVSNKIEIAKEAAKLVDPYEQIILDSSSTSWFLSKELPNIPITVLTNSLRIANEFISKDRVQVVLVGGTLLRSSLCFVGQATQFALSRYKINKAFISSKIQYDFGISEPNELAVLVKRKMISISDKVILLVDNSKFGVSDLIQVANLDRINKIITDSDITKEKIDELKEHADKVIISEHKMG